MGPLASRRQVHAYFEWVASHLLKNPMNPGSTFRPASIYDFMEETPGSGLNR